jgi:septum formation inhibitor MinC
MTAKQQKPVRLQAPAHITNGQLATVASEISNTLDSENEISEMGSMQLQMLMDTRSKLLQAASNMEKSMSDTDAAIVANMK